MNDKRIIKEATQNVYTKDQVFELLTYDRTRYVKVHKGIRREVWSYRCCSVAMACRAPAQPVLQRCCRERRALMYPLRCRRQEIQVIKVVRELTDLASRSKDSSMGAEAGEDRVSKEEAIDEGEAGEQGAVIEIK